MSYGERALLADQAACGADFGEQPVVVAQHQFAFVDQPLGHLLVMDGCQSSFTGDRVATEHGGLAHGCARRFTIGLDVAAAARSHVSSRAASASRCTCRARACGSLSSGNAASALCAGSPGNDRRGLPHRSLRQRRLRGVQARELRAGRSRYGTSPNPSYSDGYTTAAAFRISHSFSASATGPSSITASRNCVVAPALSRSASREEPYSTCVPASTSAPCQL